MAEGMNRRPQAVDSLRGAEASEPVTRNIPRGISTPTPSVPKDTYGARIAQGVAKFTSGKLQAIQKRQQEERMLDGQIAAMQGESFESVQMKGDKWALEGWRVVTAQSMSASLLRAQENDIAQGAYEQDPDQYRDTLVKRINSMTEGIEDERTRELARENLMEQTPQLVDAHMRQNLAFKEQQNFDALTQSVDVLSRSNSATGDLIAFAKGETDATSGLSVARRREAVAQGVVTAFQNNNPAAFAHLDAEGFLNTENLTVSQLQQINSARSRYESRFRKSVDTEHLEAIKQLEDRIKQGELSPLEAIEERAEINGKFGLRTGAAEAGQVYDRARAGVQFNEGTRGLNIQAAAASGDYATQAALMQEAVIQQESRGNPNAVSPKGATGIMQLMPNTAMDPGYKVRNIFEVARDQNVDFDGETEASAKELMRNEEVNKSLGTEYLEAMLREYEGDTVRALVAYNWGPGKADEWDGDIASLPNETQKYVKNITSAWSDNRPDPEGERLAAEAKLEGARKEAGLRALEQISPAMAMNDEEFLNGDKSIEDWRGTREDLYTAVGKELDAQRLNTEQQMLRTVAREQVQEMQLAGQIDQAVQVQTAQVAAQERRDARMEAIKSGRSDESVQQVQQDYLSDVIQSFESAGAPLNKEDIVTAASDSTRSMIRNANLANTAQEERLVRDRASRTGVVGDLPRGQQVLAQQEKYSEIARNAQNKAEENPDMPSSAIFGAARKEQLEWHADNNVVSDEFSTHLNMLGGMDWLTEDGQINPEVQSAIQSFSVLNSLNPDLAARHVKNPEALMRLQAAHIALQTSFPHQDAISNIDLNNDQDPRVAKFTKTVRDIELARKNNSPEDVSRATNTAIRSINRGNITGDSFGGWFTTNAGTSMTPYGAWTSGLSSTHELVDVHTTENVDMGAVDQAYRDNVTTFLETHGEYFPLTDTESLTKIALSHVNNRGAMIGNSHVMPRGDLPSIKSQTFGSNIPENPTAVHTALVEYMVNMKGNEELLSRHPAVAETLDNGFWEAPITNAAKAIWPFTEDTSNEGSFYNRPISQTARALSPFNETIDTDMMFPPFTARQQDSGHVVVTIPGSGSTVINLREAGDLYNSTRNVE